MVKEIVKYELTNKGVLNLEVIDDSYLIELYTQQDKIQTLIRPDNKIKRYVYIDLTGVLDVEEVLKALQVENNKQNSQYNNKLRELYLKKELLNKTEAKEELQKVEKAIEVNKKIRKQINLYKKYIENLLNSI